MTTTLACCYFQTTIHFDMVLLHSIKFMARNKCPKLIQNARANFIWHWSKHGCSSWSAHQTKSSQNLQVSIPRPLTHFFWSLWSTNMSQMALRCEWRSTCTPKHIQAKNPTPCARNHFLPKMAKRKFYSRVSLGLWLFQKDARDQDQLVCSPNKPRS